MTNSISYAVDTDGIATLTIDQPDRSMNVIDADFVSEFAAAIERAAGDAAVKGIIITSGKSSFIAGADLIRLESMVAEVRAAPAAEALREVSKFSQVLRRLETCGKPVACAINGTALGGGFEIALACHYRVSADGEAIKMGQPEVQVGLLPGRGWHPENPSFDRDYASAADFGGRPQYVSAAGEIHGAHSRNRPGLRAARRGQEMADISKCKGCSALGRKVVQGAGWCRRDEPERRADIRGR